MSMQLAEQENEESKQDMEKPGSLHGHLKQHQQVLWEPDRICSCHELCLHNIEQADAPICIHMFCSLQRI